jgi:UDP-glucose 4-epimerase
MNKNEYSLMKNKKVLITGGSGFIGYYLSELCKDNGGILYGIDINLPNNFSIWQDFSQSKLSDESLEKLMLDNVFDYVFHLAGSASVPFSFNFPVDDFNSLIPPTLILLHKIKKFSPSARLVIFSSAAVYGNPRSLPVYESDVIKPISPYGIHKAVNENLVEYYCNFYGISGCVLRVFSAYGEGLKKQLFWDVMQKYKSNIKQIELFGTGNETRDFVHVKDVVRAALFVSMNKFECYYNVFNVGSGVETSIRDAVDYLFTDADVIPSVSFKGQNIEGNPLNWQADIGKLESSGFRNNYNIADVLSNYLNWFSEIDE